MRFEIIQQLFGSLRPSAPRKSDELDPATIESIHRDMMMDLGVRISHAFYGYPLLLLVLWLTSSLPAEHPVVWPAVVSWMVGVNLLRAFLVIRREALFDRWPRGWQLGLLATTLSSTASLGAFLMLSATWYKLTDWNLMATLIISIGFAAASLITMTPSYVLLFTNTILMFVPSMVVAALRGEPRATAFAVAGSVFVLFLLVQGAALNRAYVDLRWEQAVAHKRSQQLEQARRDAEDASAAKSQFLANLSHEIRTPMNGILGMARLALDAKPEPAVRQNIEMLEQCAGGLLQILNDMLDFSKLDAGKFVLEQIAFAPCEIIYDVMRLLAPEAQIKGLRLDLTTPDHPVFIEADSIRLRQVLLNLVGNAIKFTNQGRVTVSCEAKAIEGRWRLTFAVEDTGIGVDPAHRDVIFEAFRQADGSVTRRFGGTGLGLAISARIVEAMGGKIEVAGAPGKGSRFFFTCEFPQAEPQSIIQLHQSLAVNPASPPLTILAVEDNAVNQRLIERLLSRHGHKVTVATNGVEALEAARNARFDLILMDISMPEMDGIEASRQLRQWEVDTLAHPTPILALTANAMNGDRERFAAAGMDGYLAKPFSPEQLYRLIEQFSPPVADSSYSN